jgi:PAS domain S-box-containing protein
VLKHWLPVYSTDITLILKLNSEIDDLKLGQNTTFANTYIQILKERIEEELHFSENLIHASPSITYIFDLIDQKISYINGKVEAIMGYTTQEILAKETNLITDFIHLEDQSAIEQLIKGLMEDQQGKTFQTEFRIINKQETYDWMRCYCVVYKRDESGRPTQVLASGYKINEEKETATALLKREKLLLEAQAIAHIGSFEWDIVNDTSVSSPELRSIFEANHWQTLEEMMEKVHPDDKRKLHIALQKAFSSGNFTCEYRYLAKSGEKVIDSRGVVTFSSQGEPVLMTGTVQDITTRKQIENNLLKKTLELQRSNVQLQEFAYVASHDLKEPLRKIITFSDVLISTEDKALSEKTKVNLQKITNAVLRMQQLIDGILSYSSIEYEVQKQPYNLEELLQEVLTNLEYQIKEKDAEVTSDGLPQAEVVPFQIQQLFQNLLVNALKFSKKDVPPQITISHTFLAPEEVQGISVQPSGRYLQIQVSDNGIGFGKESTEKIFGLFQRLHGRTAYGGSGLGLAICRKIVDSHGGAITAASEPDKGATFRILLPSE